MAEIINDGWGASVALASLTQQFGVQFSWKTHTRLNLRGLAQLVARMHGVHEATGSNPVSPIKFW